MRALPHGVTAAAPMLVLRRATSISLNYWDHRKGQTVKKLSILAVALLALVIASAAATAVKPKPIAFIGKYAGTATTQAADNTVTITASGTGAGTKIGSGKVAGKGTGDSSVQPCVPFTGLGTITGAKGTLTFKVNPGSTGCGDEAGQLFSVSGKATVLKGTGLLAKRKGTLRMSGTFDRSSGAFTVKFTGSLTA